VYDLVLELKARPDHWS